MPQVLQFTKLMGYEHFCTWARNGQLLSQNTLRDVLQRRAAKRVRISSAETVPNCSSFMNATIRVWLNVAVAHTPKSQIMAAERKTEFAVCQTKMVRYNLGVKCHQYHSNHQKQASGTVSPGISAVLQATASSMTYCNHLQPYLSTTVTPRVAVLVGLQKIVTCSPLQYLLQRMAPPDQKQGCQVPFVPTQPFYTNLRKAVRASTPS